MKKNKKNLTAMLAQIDKIGGALDGLKARISAQVDKIKKSDDCMGRAIRHFMDEGREQDQAVAIAYSICGEKCVSPFRARKIAKDYAKSKK